MGRVLKHVRRTLWLALDHDVFNTAKAAAYSGMLCFFPAVLVLTALLAQVPAGPSLVGELRGSFDEILPPESMNLLQSSFSARHLRSTQVVWSAASLAVFAGLGVMLSLMEGFRRAYKIRRDSWGFWERRLRALLLVPIVLLPLSLASLLLVFGHQIEDWIIVNADHELRHFVIVFWRVIRWAVAVSTGVVVLAALYFFGTKRREHWGWVLPGAIAATLVWFPATLGFGFYVTRVADYSRFYGSFAAGIATLVWLYLTSFSALLGAELNGVLYQARQGRMEAASYSGMAEAAAPDQSSSSA
ncbi:MAG TPA: YihY/virulence factor BrkB family protein [Terracidiphilus sp.]|jgi:membrane protein|nr:YihY/virulence factor BrkB family protein [Terracidiphilus sp.]